MNGPMRRLKQAKVTIKGDNMSKKDLVIRFTYVTIISGLTGALIVLLAL